MWRSAGYNYSAGMAPMTTLCLRGRDVVVKLVGLATCRACASVMLQAEQCIGIALFAPPSFVGPAGGRGVKAPAPC